MGIAVRALSDDELTADFSGIDVTWYKFVAAAVASASLGLAGSLYGLYNGIVSPNAALLDPVVDVAGRAVFHTLKPP